MQIIEQLDAVKNLVESEARRLDRQGKSQLGALGPGPNEEMITRALNDLDNQISNIAESFHEMHTLIKRCDETIKESIRNSSKNLIVYSREEAGNVSPQTKAKNIAIVLTIVDQIAGIRATLEYINKKCVDALSLIAAQKKE